MTTLLSRDQMVRTAVRSMQIMAGGDLDEFRAVVHPQATNREAKDEPPACRGTGPEAFHATARWLRAAFSDLAFTIAETVVEGDLVVTHGTMSGRHTGDFVVWNENADVERVFVPTGRTFEVHHAHFLRISDDQVIEHWAVRDDQSMAMQAGWIPPSPLFLFRCARATRKARRVTAHAR